METEAALLWGFIVLILLVIATIIGLLVQAGLFAAVDVKTCKPDFGDLEIAYKFAKGPYKEAGSLFTHVHTLLPRYRTIGVYYDDPNKKQPHKLRYIVGVIIGEGNSPTLPEDVKLLEEHGYRLAKFPAIDHAVQTTFPFNSTISIIVAIMKVYPALRDYIEKRSLCAHPFLEVYDNDKCEILFVGPLARQDAFYVPEVLEEEEEEEQQDYDDDEDNHTENSSVSWEGSINARGLDQNESEYSDSISNEIPAIVSQAPGVLVQPGLPPSQPVQLVGEVGQEASSVPLAHVERVTAIAELIEVRNTGDDEESDANTASSFEEIDEKDVPLLPVIEPQVNEPSIMKEDEEGER